VRRSERYNRGTHPNGGSVVPSLTNLLEREEATCTFLTLVNFLIERSRKTEYRCPIAEGPFLNPVVDLYKKAGFRQCEYNDRHHSNSGKEIALWMSLDLE
jgi:hypothetical protein